MTQEETSSEQDPNSAAPEAEMIETESLEPELSSVEEVEYKDKYLRLLAELENTRKRLQKEKREMTRFAVENVIEEFLSPMDNLENALKCTQNMSEETLNWARGFEMILTQFKEILSQNGVAPFKSEGELFDPHLHEAVEVEEHDECEESVVLQEFVRGYKSASRVVRPARVKVSKKKSPAQED